MVGKETEPSRMGIYICLLDGESLPFHPDCLVKTRNRKLIYKSDLIYTPISLRYINID
jgi:hypothetical protein